MVGVKPDHLFYKFIMRNERKFIQASKQKANRILLKKVCVKWIFKKNLRKGWQISFNRFVGSIN